ncbi:MAG: hypothetical protein ACI9FZ_000650 [Bacteroidia bacterium]|jgi:hypothetical protein
MIADEPRQPLGIGTPDDTLLDADAFHYAIVAFIVKELPVWRDRPTRPKASDEPSLNQTLCLHLNSAARRQCFDSIQFLQEPLQPTARRVDIGVMPLGTITVEGRSYEDFEQLLPIECKRLPTPIDKRRNDCEYVHGLPGHRTGAIERFKHGLHGPQNRRALIIAYVQSESFAHWLATINERLVKLADNNTDHGLWSPSELLSTNTIAPNNDIQQLLSQHRRISDSACIDIEHLWILTN